MSAPNLRARRAPLPPSTSEPAPVVISPPKRTSTSPPSSRIPSVLDLLRVLGGVLLLSSASSWFVTGNSVSWGWRPGWSRWARLKTLWQPPLHLTDLQLALYNGTDPALPILLALNGSIYDVSASPHLYGPGGSYNFFAGRDATRAFVTGCFDVDLVGDLRGVEEMFVPVSVEEGEGEGVGQGSKMSSGEKKIKRERERRLARKQVEQTVEGWRKMFDGGKGGKYFKRGVVDRGEGSGWAGWGEVRELCEKARKGRPGRRAEEV